MNGLPTLASTLAAKGRGPDQMLVHMSPREVAGLQSLAMAHGGSLTINPHTGLPEAGFLDGLLPALLGVGLNFFLPGVGTAIGSALGGLSGAAGTGILVGGLTGLATGDLGKGIMAGLGAYGGAGLGESLAGASGVGAQAAGANLTGQELAKSAAENAALEGFNLPADYAQLAGRTATQDQLSTLGKSAVEEYMTKSPWERAAQSFDVMGQPGGLKTFGSNLVGQYGGKLGTAAAAAPIVSSMLEPPKLTFPEPKKSNYAGPYYPTERQVSYPDQDFIRSSREYTYFTPSNPMPGFVSSQQQQEADAQQSLLYPSSLLNRTLYADGGAVAPFEDNALKMPAADYNVNQGEFNYNFRPISIEDSPLAPGSKPTSFSEGIAGVLSKLVGAFNGKPNSNYIDLSAYRYDPTNQQMVKMATGGSVPTLEDGGFVLTKKAVDGIGGGDNQTGQKVASAGLGAIPLKGKGHGTSDSIKTSIEGKIPARVSNGEAYVPRSNVKKAGGADKLYALMKKAERKA